MSYQLLIGDCRAKLRELPTASVQTVVTSPPYWNLRQYLFDGAVQIKANLPPEQRACIAAQLAERGILPKQ